MLVRYGTSPEGKIVKKAVIYTADDHKMEAERIDQDARRVIARLRRAGFDAFIVGGAIRDLLTGRGPKDFDIGTSALPRQIRKLFSNSRIIGKRFRLVHLYYSRSRKRKIIEVSTFRSKKAYNNNNIYGSLEEDVWRRDFTMNALLYCPLKQIVIDYVGGFQDIWEEKIRTLIPVQDSFLEDPVRMIRAIRYAGQTGFSLSSTITRGIQRYRNELPRCSPARITEEVYKILQCGHSASILYMAFRLRILEVMLPAVDQHLRSGRKKEREEVFVAGLRQLDERILKNPQAKIDRGKLLSVLFKELFKSASHDFQEDNQNLLTQKFLRKIALPLLPSRREIIKAASILQRGEGNRACGSGRRSPLL